MNLNVGDLGSDESYLKIMIIKLKFYQNQSELVGFVCQ
jgi:hypothetical protein